MIRGHHGNTVRSATWLLDDGDTGLRQRRPLHPVEFHERLLLVKDRAELCVLRSCQIALRLNDEEVRLQAGGKLAQFGLQLFRGQFDEYFICIRNRYVNRPNGTG